MTGEKGCETKMDTMTAQKRQVGSWRIVVMSFGNAQTWQNRFCAALSAQEGSALSYDAQIPFFCLCAFFRLSACLNNLKNLIFFKSFGWIILCVREVVAESYVLTYCIKWVTTSLTYNIMCLRENNYIKKYQNCLKI